MSTTNVKGAKKLEEELDQKMYQIEDERLEDKAKQTAQQSGHKYLNLRFFPIDNNALFMVEESEARSANMAVIAKIGMTLTAAVLDPNGAPLQTIVTSLTTQGFTVNMVIASSHGLSVAWARYKLKKDIRDETRGVMSIDQNEVASQADQIKNIKDLKTRITSLPITKVLNTLIAGALKIGASDIHFEPEEHVIRLRYRLDGVLTDVVDFSTTGYPDILSRIKLDAGLKINVHQVPQDGRFTIRLKEKDIEVRVSVLPGAYGENIVMRLLDPSSIRQKLEDLGMREDTLRLAKKLLQKTTGTILNTGPTGSGKTTTLYAFVQFINSSDVKIITIEDPIEYHIDGISQTQTNESAGYTFAEGLRSIVRQDPDIILVGEIRDQETAEICMQAALTGHLVLSTIHTNDAAGTIPRLIDLGVKPVTIAPALNAAMAQRLVRRLCEVCRKEEKIHAEDFAVISKHLSKLPSTVKAPVLSEDMNIYYPVGCDTCSHSGYKGRIGVYEIFEIDDDMQKLIMEAPSVVRIKELAVKKGLTTLLQDAFIKVLHGMTSVDEVMRVIGE